MKILHITDSHATIKSPSGRQDIYYVSFLRKLYEVGYVIKHENIDLVLHTGDFFHTPHISDKFTGQIAEMIQSWKVPVYVVPGNHDIEGYTIDTLDQTKLGLMYKTGVLKRLDRLNPLSINISDNNNSSATISISGQEYYQNIDSGNDNDFKMQQPISDLNILCIHGYLTDKPQHPDIKHTLVKDILNITDADIILSGHFHQRFFVEEENLSVYNPGSMMRIEQNEYNKNNMPCYGILEIGFDNNDIVYNYDFHEFKTAIPANVAFDYNSKYVSQNNTISINNFTNNIANSVGIIAKNNNLIDIIDDIFAKNATIDNTLYQLCIDTINNTKQQLPDTFDIKQGYLIAQNKIYISSIEIKNFQSHKDTKIDFDNGLNVIVGESNNGKTSIIRAIMWVVDDTPSGNSFITAGETDCQVKINYSNGAYILRHRTMSSSGEYKIGYYDENNNFTEQTYKGFHNNIPVEVSNIHQMPYVNIAKDLATHLNVINQFDRPFLITESPNVKAAVIGRITGTHIIDAGIKSINSSILSLNKEIKTHTANLEEYKDRKSKLADLQQAIDISDKLNAIYNSANAIYNSAQSCEYYFTEVNKIVFDITTVNNNARNYKALNDFSPVVKVIKNMGEDIKYYQDKLSEINNIELEIEELNKKIFNLNKINIIKNNITTISHEMVMYNNLNNIYLEYISVNYQENNLNHNIKYYLMISDTLKAFINRLNIINFFDAKNILDQVQELNINIQEINNNINAKQLEINNNKSQIVELINNIKACPCCGQPINDDNTKKHLVNYFNNRKEDK